MVQDLKDAETNLLVVDINIQWYRFHWYTIEDKLNIIVSPTKSLVIYVLDKGQWTSEWPPHVSL